MSRMRHFTKTFALLVCLAAMFSSLGCSDSVVAPTSGPADATAGSKDMPSTLDGPNQANYDNVGG